MFSGSSYQMGANRKWEIQDGGLQNGTKDDKLDLDKYVTAVWRTIIVQL